MAQTKSPKPTPLETQVEQLLTEARVIIPGAQALLGFQLTVTLTRAFQQLPADARQAISVLPIAAGEARIAPTAALGERRTGASTASPMPRLPRLDDLRILVVDDNADGRILTSMVLTQAGASVQAAASAREALQMLEAERPDVLVSDIGLPDEDGYRLISQIRLYEAERGGFLPAVALTGYARAEDRARILAAGFQAHVPKPVDPIELAAAIATITQHLRDSQP